LTWVRGVPRTWDGKGTGDCDWGIYSPLSPHSIFRPRRNWRFVRLRGTLVLWWETSELVDGEGRDGCWVQMVILCFRWEVRVGLEDSQSPFWHRRISHLLPGEKRGGGRGGGETDKLLVSRSRRRNRISSHLFQISKRLPSFPSVRHLEDQPSLPSLTPITRHHLAPSLPNR
jgi:hypothetical protein